MQLNSFLCSCGLVLGLALAAPAQQAGPVPSGTPPAGSSHIDNEFVQKQFGESCALMPGPAPLKADLDGDGVEDIVIVARCRNPLPDQVEHKFRVVDPYNQYFGFGDPKVTTEFASEDPDLRGISLLIIHGSGPEAWGSATPKAKFLVINLPFKNLSVKKIMVHKKPTMAIFAEEAREGEGTISALYWDGKKYKYQPMGTSME